MKRTLRNFLYLIKSTDPWNGNLTGYRAGDIDDMDHPPVKTAGGFELVIPEWENTSNDTVKVFIGGFHPKENMMLVY